MLFLEQLDLIKYARVIHLSENWTDGLSYYCCSIEVLPLNHGL